MPDAPERPYNPHRRIAVIFDFDDTIVRDSTSRFLETKGVSTTTFWEHDAAGLVKAGYDPSLAWLKVFLDNVGEEKLLGCVSRTELRAFGASLDADIFEGLRTLPSDLKALAAANNWKVDFYVVSGGLEDLIRGLPFIRDNFTEVYATRLAESGSPPRVSALMRVISFTEKTRYLFEISKGITADQTLEQPYAVNDEVDKSIRPVPFDCMIYIGDGPTDIPCFSLLRDNGGIPWGVFDPRRKTQAKWAYQKLLRTRRRIPLHSPKYGPDDDLGFLIRESVAEICGRATTARSGGS